MGINKKVQYAIFHGKEKSVIPLNRSAVKHIQLFPY